VVVARRARRARRRRVLAARGGGNGGGDVLDEIASGRGELAGEVEPEHLVDPERPGARGERPEASGDDASWGDEPAKPADGGAHGRRRDHRGHSEALARVVEELTERDAALSARVATAQRAEREELVATLAHEVNNQLVTVLANARFLDEELRVDGESREALQELIAGAERVAQIVREMKALARATGVERVSWSDLRGALSPHVQVQDSEVESVSVLGSRSRLLLYVESVAVAARGGSVDVSVDARGLLLTFVTGADLACCGAAAAEALGCDWLRRPEGWRLSVPFRMRGEETPTAP
jgi:signal transduction histidine kinase